MEDPLSGDRTIDTYGIKPRKDKDIIGQNSGTPKEAKGKQKDQELTGEEQTQDAPVRTTPEILETSVSEKPQMISQITPEARPAHTMQNFAAHDSPQDISPGRAGSPDGSTYTGGVTTAGNQIAHASGSGVSSGLKKAEYLRKNFLYIRDMIQKRIIYPPLARRMGWEGKVTVSFIIVSDGHVNEIEVKESSGRDILDTSAIETIRAASPFPAPPIAAQIIIPILYRLN
jgi:protein TonB